MRSFYQRHRAASLVSASIILLLVGLALNGAVAAWFLLIFLLFAVTAPFVVIGIPLLIHELGHLLAGHAAGFKFFALHLCNIEIRRVEGKIRVYSVGKWSGLYGLALMEPRTKDRLLSRYRIFVSGGPLASLLLAGLAGTTWYVLEKRYPHIDKSNFGLLIIWLNGLTLFSGYFALFSILPYRGRRFPSDGLSLLRSFYRRTGRQLELSFLLNAPIMRGARARDWDIESLTELISLSPAKEAAYVNLLLLRYYYYLDSGMFADALRTINEAASILPKRDNIVPMQSAIILTENAYAIAFISHDAATARETLTLAEEYSLGKLESQRHRARAAILRAEGDTEGADEAATLADSTMRSQHTKPGQIPDNLQAELDWIEKLRSVHRDNIAAQLT